MLDRAVRIYPIEMWPGTVSHERLSWPADRQLKIELAKVEEKSMTMRTLTESAIKNVLHRIGCDIHRYHYDKATGRSLYEPVHPQATYSPWNKDSIFLETYHAIKSNTLADKYRCFELWSLVHQSTKLSGCLIEIGVWRGGTGALIAKRALLSGIKAPVYLCDTFSGIVKASDKDSTYKGYEYADTTPQAVEQLLVDLQISNAHVLEGTFPDDTAHLIQENTFRFCHIDVDVYQSAKEISDWIWEKMSIGGVIVYDDYGFPSCDGITKFVEEQHQNPDRIILHNLNGHAVVIKIR